MRDAQRWGGNTSVSVVSGRVMVSSDRTSTLPPFFFFLILIINLIFFNYYFMDRD